VLLACVLVLLVSQGLIGALSLSALHRLAYQNTHERVSLVSRQAGADIQAGLNLGKPLTQYFGLSEYLKTVLKQLPNGGSAQVVLANGDIVQQAGAAAPADAVRVDVPLQDRSGVQGVLRVQGLPEKVGVRVLLFDNLRVLGGITGLALVALLLVFRFIMPVHHLAAAGRLRLLVPLCVMLVAQGAYAAYTVQSFKSVWLGMARENASLLGQRLQADFHRLLDYGIAPERWVGVEKILVHQAAAFPLVKALIITNPKANPLFAADARGSLAHDSLPGSLQASTSDVRFPLVRTRARTPDAWLYVQLDEQQLRQGVWQRVVDAATVVVVALVVTLELLLLLTLLIDRAFAVPLPRDDAIPLGLDDVSRIGSVVRPVMFGFMFAVALPLSFIPLHARSLLGEAGGGIQSLQMAWPVALEMGCGLLTALVAGRLIDRRGWPLPVFAGLLITGIAGVLAALAQSLAGFMAARALSGLGYGLAWMGLQGFIVVASPARERGRNMAIVIAGLFAGHLSGAAVGALLAEQSGRSAVFAVSAVLLILPALGVRMLMWPYRGLGKGHSGPVPLAVAHSWRQTLGLLFSRDYGLLLAGSIIPFSVAQVGLLSFALPLYMEQAGASTASTGRVLMAYGLCVIYLAPLVARLADRSRSRKPWIVAGGVTGSLGLFGLYLANTVMMATLAVILLALASCLAGGAQASYMLSLNRVQAFGAASATSVMRAGDKLGQMLGPLLVGALLGWAGISVSLALVGCLYLMATLSFWLWAPLDHAGRASVDT
jgi:MFS family permease